MSHLIRPAVISLVLLGCSAAPCWAQHMNSPQAPCRQAVVTSDATACFERASKKADGELNKLYAEIRSTLQPGDQQKLQDAERAWLKFRDATCTAERDLYEGGTGAFPAYAACIEEETRQRAIDLRTIYGWQLEK